MIRELRIEDLDSINEIGLLIKDDFNNHNNTNEILDSNVRFLYVYEEDNLIKGFIEIEKHFEVIDIINIAVLEEHQNKNIATMLINYIVINNEIEKMILEVKETNTKAIKFYLKNGFKEINRRKKYYDGIDAIIMERSI